MNGIKKLIKARGYIALGHGISVFVSDEKKTIGFQLTDMGDGYYKYRNVRIDAKVEVEVFLFATCDEHLFFKLVRKNFLS